MNNQEIQNIFAARIKKAATSAGYKTQKALADDLGLSAQVVNYYFKGSTMPDAYTLSNIAAVLGVSCDYLLGIADFPTVKEDLQQAEKTTGLSPDAVNTLSMLKRNGDYFFADFIDILLNDVQDAIKYRKGAISSCLGLLYEYCKSKALSKYTIELKGQPEIKVEEGYCIRGQGLKLGLEVPNDKLKDTYCELLLKEAIQILDDLSRYEDFKRKEAE